MNAVLIQHAYPVGTFQDNDFVCMMELTKERNQKYCERFGFDFWYEVYADEERLPLTSGSWMKVELIKKALEKGYEYIVWLDPDSMIYDDSIDLRKAFEDNKIGACWHRIPQLDHWNVGVLYIHNSEATRKFIDDWLASYPPPPDGWAEQGVFNRMARASDTVVTVSDKWNATLDVNMVPDAVVLGFHGQRDWKYRYSLMQKTMIKIADKESAKTAQA